MYIDMELCNRTLSDYMADDLPGAENGITMAHVSNVMVQITNRLVYVHEKGDVHRDLRPHNSTAPYLQCIKTSILILVLRGKDPRVWKFIDFGLTSEASSRTFITLITSNEAKGAGGYRPPIQSTQDISFEGLSMDIS